MAAYKFYEWERSRFPNNYSTKVEANDVVRLTRMYADAFKVYRDTGYFQDAIEVNLNNRSWGRAHLQKGRIDLPFNGCSLGMILHEVAHLLDWKLNKGRGHTKTFKHTLIKCQVEGSGLFDKFMEKIDEQNKTQKEEFQKRMERETKKAVKISERKAYAKTRAYKIERTSKRIGRLERKIKSLTTRLKSAKRSLSALHRAEVKSNSKQSLSSEVRPS